jgi:hypothetical protein
VLVLGVLFMPLEIPSGDAETSYADLLEYRRNVLSILLTVFGAWVGAGAAYFFGQENFREAASSLLQMRDASPIEILRRTPLRNLPPRPITWVAKPDQKLTDVVAHLRATSGAWFVPIVDDQGKLAAVVHQDGVWRFVMDQVSGGQTYADALDHTVQEVLDALTGDLARLRDIHVVVNMDKNASDVYALLQRRGTETYLAVITDEAGRPTHFVTTGDVRRVLLDAQITAI